MSQNIDANWDELICNLPGSHLLQTTEWAETKKDVGWEGDQLTVLDSRGNVIAAAMVLTRKVKLPGIRKSLSVCYVPRGPILDWSDSMVRDQMLTKLEIHAKEKKAIFIKIDPEIAIGFGVPASINEKQNEVGILAVTELEKHGWRNNVDQIQFKNTVILDLSRDEEFWLGRMKQKARYNLRLSQRSGVSVREATIPELGLLYKMYAHTAYRDGFIIREEDYYLRVWTKFIQHGMAIPLVAEVEGTPVAGLILFIFGKSAWYLYGMSTELHRDKMPNYQLQWVAMQKAKAAGCERYDLWGAPDKFDESDSMFGVFRFKDGLGGEVLRTSGAWDFVVQPSLYFLYQGVLPKFLSISRRFRKAQIKQEVS